MRVAVRRARASPARRRLSHLDGSGFPDPFFIAVQNEPRHGLPFLDVRNLATVAAEMPLAEGVRV